MVECFEMLFIILLGLSIALSSAQVDFASEVTVIATVGEAFILPCRPTDSGHVVWSRLNEIETRGPSGVIELTDGGRMLNGHGKRLAFHFTDEGDQSLGIFNTTLADAGVYFCTQHNGLKHKVILRVNALVKTVSRENITAIVGERAVIPCPLSYTGPVVWSRDKSSALGNGGEVIATGGIVTSRFIERVSLSITESGYHSLMISNVTLDDARLYRCNTGNDGTKHHYVFLQVVQDTTRTVDATVGHSVTLKCFPSLAADVRWTRKNQGVPSMISFQGRILEDYIADFSLQNSGKGFHHLVIHKFRESDAGLYVCEENNGLGEQHKVLLRALIGDNGHVPVTKSTVAAELEETSSAWKTAVSVLIILLILLIIVVVIILSVYIRRRYVSKKKHKKAEEKKKSDEEKKELLKATDQPGNLDAVSKQTEIVKQSSAAPVKPGNLDAVSKQTAIVGQSSAAPVKPGNLDAVSEQTAIVVQSSAAPVKPGRTPQETSVIDGLNDASRRPTPGFFDFWESAIRSAFQRYGFQR